MKCNKCGKEFEGNFCPQCGSPSTKNNLNRTLDNPEEKEIKKGFSSESKDVIGGAINLYLHSRLKYIFLGAFVSAFCMFSIEKIISGLALTILGILLFPPVLKRFWKRQRILVGVVAVLCLGVAIVTGEGTNRSKGTIEYVKQYQTQGLSYSIGELLDMSDLKVKWKYYKEDNTDYVTAEFDDEPGKIKLIFKVEDYPELYDVLLNGKSNEELYEGFNSRLFDKEEGSIEKSELGESQDSLDDTVTENESVDSQDIDLSLEGDPDVWFITYNSFYRTRDIGGIEINVMNDAVMFVQCTGSDGTVAE